MTYGNIALVPVMALLKADLGMTHEKLDDRLMLVLQGCASEITDERGIVLKLDLPADMLLLSDFAAWRWRTRMEDSPALSDSLRMRLRSRGVRRRAYDIAE